MTFRTRSCITYVLLALALLILYATTVEARGGYTHPKRLHSPCRREMKELCSQANETRAEALHCLEKNVNSLKEGRCRTLIVGLTSCRADLLAVATDEDVTDSPSGGSNTSLDCAGSAFTGDLRDVSRCLRQWHEKRDVYGADLITTNCTNSKFFAKATRRHGGHRKGRGSVSGRKSRK